MKLGVAAPEEAAGWRPLPSRSEAAGTGKQEGSSLSLSLDFLSKCMCCLQYAEFNGKLAGYASWVMRCAESQPGRS